MPDGGVQASDLKALEKAMKDTFSAMQENIKKTQDLAEKAREEVRQEGTLHGKTNEQLTELGNVAKKLDGELKAMADKWGEMKDRVQDVEQKLAKRPVGGSADEYKSAGRLVAESAEFKAAMESGAPNMRAVKVGSFFKANITNDNVATSVTINPLAPSQQIGMIMPATRRLTVRDLIPAGRTGSNLIEFVTENTFTNAAAIQGVDSSPSGQYDGLAKPESAITFTHNQAPVRTIAHWIPASRQVMADAAMLESYINIRLTYGLKIEEEDEILNGAGTGGHINGLVNQAADFTGGVTNQTALDTLLKAFTQVSLADYEATGVVLHPSDWLAIQLLKDTTGRYLFADPQAMTSPRVWGKDVIATASMTSGTFLAGAFSLGAQIWDREDATVRVSESHANFFIQNMVCVLAEERVALTVYRPTAFVTGNVSHAG